MSELEIKAKQYADLFYSNEFETEEVLFKKADIKTAYKQGFEDGFNVDRWHYPSKGEYPTEKDRQYFCKVKDCREEWYEVVGWGDFWLLDEFNQVVAWQYFVPPKEEA